MSSDTSNPELDQQVRLYSGYESFKHNAALSMLVLAPVLIAIPPRKLDLYTFSLTGAFVASINQLTVERTGRGLISQFGYGRQARALEMQRLHEENTTHRLLEESAVPEEVLRRNTGSGTKGFLEEKAKEIWLGGETEGWKEKRLREEQEKLNQGEGYGGMIMDQIWEVWTWGQDKGEKLKEKDEKVLAERKTLEKK